MFDSKDDGDNRNIKLRDFLQLWVPEFPSFWGEERSEDEYFDDSC